MPRQAFAKAIAEFLSSLIPPPVAGRLSLFGMGESGEPTEL